MSIASSAMRMALGIMSIEPPKFKLPTIIVPPRVFFPNRDPHSATKTGKARLGVDAHQWIAYAQCIRGLLESVPELRGATT